MFEVIETLFVFMHIEITMKLTKITSLSVFEKQGTNVCFFAVMNISNKY